jgi:hypothetical protein
MHACMHACMHRGSARVHRTWSEPADLAGKRSRVVSRSGECIILPLNIYSDRSLPPKPCLQGSSYPWQATS